ncbi:MAG: BCCT family transporter, partial [Myxococcota bacterium]
PLIGERIYGRVGDMVDTLAVVSTLFGVATSLGLGAMQVNAGFNYVFGLAESENAQMVIIACITAAATVSVVSGLDVGIRRLSELNMLLAFALLMYVFIAGPTNFLLDVFVENLGSYIRHLPAHSFWTASFEPDQRRWLTDWTVFYWSWWVAWAPFVGMFIARISRGRTIREFLASVLIGPTVIGFIWLTVFGDTALFEEVYGDGGISKAVEESIPTAIFVLLDHLPAPSVTGFICSVSIILFFVTSSDSASLVVDTIASGGKSHPPIAQRIYWAVLEGVVAATLLAIGGLRALQTATIATALPFTIILIIVCVGMTRSLRNDLRRCSR